MLGGIFAFRWLSYSVAGRGVVNSLGRLSGPLPDLLYAVLITVPLLSLPAFDLQEVTLEEPMAMHS